MDLELRRDQEAALRSKQERVSGTLLDRSVPRADRAAARRRQQALQHQVDSLLTPLKPPRGASPGERRAWNAERSSLAASRREQAIDIQHAFWSDNDTYVDDDHRVYAATFDPSSAVLTLERNDGTNDTEADSETCAAAPAEGRRRTRQIRLDGTISDELVLTKTNPGPDGTPVIHQTRLRTEVGFGADGRPMSSTVQTDTLRQPGAGQDDDTDRVTEKVVRSNIDADGVQRFEPFAKIRVTVEGKDGAMGESWDAPIDIATGDDVIAPPDDWTNPWARPADDVDGAFGAPVDPLDTPQVRQDAWKRQNVHSFDDRSARRVFKDTATDAMTIGAAVLGAAAVLTGVGAPAGALLIGTSVALGAATTASMAEDFASGRNKVSGLDVTLSAAQVAPGAGAGVTKAASTLAATARASRALDLTSTALAGGGAGVSTGEQAADIYVKVQRGENVSPADFINLTLAIIGGYPGGGAGGVAGGKGSGDDQHDRRDEDPIFRPKRAAS
ncbi:MAG: DUF4126 domain-containing protein [Thermoleophilia bacterium]|nr:DUF4126 domain-containing protein [Thermoleophilia bacterium]